MPSQDGRRAARRNAPQPVADIVAWRRRALEQQLPDARFPGGVVAPGLVGLFGLLLTAILCFALLATTSGSGVPQAAVDSQRDLVRQVVRTAEIGIARNTEALAQVVEDSKSKTDNPAGAVVKAVVGDGTEWEGAAVFEATSRKTLESAGKPFDLPTTMDPHQQSIVGRFVNGEPQLVTVVPLDDSRAVAAISVPTFRSLRLNPHSQHGIILGTASGETALLQGVDNGTEVGKAQITQVLQQAVTDARTISVSGEPDDDNRALLVTGRHIGETGLVIVSVAREALLDGGRPLQGFPAAGSLVIAALVCAGVTFLSLVRPMRRLLGQAIADASGEPGARRTIRRPREIARISAALSANSPPRRGVPVMVFLWLGCLPVLAWPAAIVFHYGHQPVAAPAQVISDESARIESTGYALGNSLDLGLERVTEIAAQLAEPTPAAAKPVFERVLRSEHRFRGIYLVDASGVSTLSVGRGTLRQPKPLPGEGGIRLDAIAGRLPVIYAYQVKSNGTGIVAEFDVQYLTGLLRQKDGRVRVLDSDLRTILDSEGFVAFQQLSGAAQREAAIAALGGQTTSAVAHTRGSEIGGKRLIASSTITEPDTVAHLEWAIVSDRQLTALDLPATMRYRAAALVGGIAGALALFTLGWQYFLLVRPLRALARAADAVSAGRYGSPVQFRRHDEIGAVAACLELRRQVEMYGGSRFGGAIRLRGDADDFTSVIPRVDEASPRSLAVSKGRG